MLGSKRVVCVIPARLKSTRFPRKVLASLLDKPLLQWVWEAASKINLFDAVVFAIDSEETAQLIDRFGGGYHMTSEECPSGTDRLVELAQRGVLKADIWVNWQGDEPFIYEKMIQDLLQSCQTDQSDLWTLCKQITHVEDSASPQVAKVVFDAQGYALYFSRSTIPYYRDLRDPNKQIFYKHVGLYAFTQEALEKIGRLKPCYLEEAEQLEQLRFIYNGLRVRVHQTEGEVFGIDLPEHLIKAELFLNSARR